MGKTCKPNYDAQIEDFLKKEDTDNIVQKCSDAALATEIKSNISDKLSESTPGFSKDALFINGYSPINELVGEIKSRVDNDVKTIDSLSGKIKSEGYKHTIAEVEEYETNLKEEYTKRQTAFTDALDRYNKKVVLLNQEVDEHNAAERNKGPDEVKNILNKKPIISTKEEEKIEPFTKLTFTEEPDDSVEGAHEVRTTQQNLAQAFEKYVAIVYEKVKDWKDLPTDATTGATDGSTTATGGITVDRDYQSYSKLSDDLKTNAEHYGDCHVVKVKDEKGNTVCYRYNLDGKLIEVNVVDSEGNNNYYTSTGVPATKLDDIPSQPVVPTSVYEGKDSIKFDGGIFGIGSCVIIHRIEDGKSVFYTYEKDGTLRSVKDDKGNDVNGQALNYDGGNRANTNIEIEDGYGTYDANKMNTASSGLDGTHVAWEYNEKDGSSTYYRYDNKNELIEVHVVDENGNNYFYDGTGAPASKVGPNADVSQRGVIPNDVLKGGEVRTNGSYGTPEFGTTVKNNGITIQYDSYGHFKSATDAKGNPINEENVVSAINNASSDSGQGDATNVENNESK